MDRLSPEARSSLMSRIRGRNTKPELAVRRLLHAKGYRYRLHRTDLPGSPDLVFPSRRKVIMIHGCFWHRHPGCRFASTPKSRTEFWDAKFAANIRRDARDEGALRELGWEVLVVWECELRSSVGLSQKLANFLGAPGSSGRPSITSGDIHG